MLSLIISLSLFKKRKTSINFGFNKGAKPWLHLNTHCKDINVLNSLEDEDSVLNYYKKLISFRKGSYKDLLVDSNYERMTSYERSTDMFVYRKYDNNNEIIAFIRANSNCSAVIANCIAFTDNFPKLTAN